MKMMSSLFGILFFFMLLITAVSCALTDSQTMSTHILNSGTISDRNISEASGIAVSRVNEDTLWVINDSGNSPSVYALDFNGKNIGTLDIQGVTNNDWEDLASFEYKGKTYILIADVGDNFARRSKCFLHIIEEPDIRKISKSSPLAVNPAWSITFTYEDGPRDCEAVAVDTADEKIFLLSKRDRPLILYSLPIKMDKEGVAARCAEIKPFPLRIQDNSENSKYSNQPTAMDISSDGLSAVILTYGNAYYFIKNKSDEWATVFSGTMKEIIFPPMKQAESVCFNRDGKSIYITSEQLPAPLLKIDLKK